MGGAVAPILRTVAASAVNPIAGVVVGAKEEFDAVKGVYSREQERLALKARDEENARIAEQNARNAEIDKQKQAIDDLKQEQADAQDKESAASKARALRAEQRRKQAEARGRRGTILTSPLGIPDVGSDSVQPKNLLGM